MRVRMNVTMSGTRDGVDWPAIGGEIDLPTDEALAYLANGVCVPVRNTAEQAVDPKIKAEKAVLK